MGTKIYVGNMGPGLTPRELYRAFATHGTVRSIVMPDSTASPVKSFALVEMDHEWAARAAMTALNGVALMGSALVVREARFREGRQ